MHVMTIFTYSGLITLIIIGRNTVSMMWQSWELKWVIVRSFIETRLLMLEEKVVCTFTALSHWQKALLSSLVRFVAHAWKVDFISALFRQC
jgi:hypothetical protein